MKNIQKLFYWVIILGAVLVAGLTVSAKKNFHIDETLSYTLSNNLENANMIEEGKIYSKGELPWLDAMTANGESRFNINNVWNNQKNDVHPPLYYVLLNFLCSIFPGKFSIWFPGIINILFFLLSTFLVWRCSIILNHDTKISLIVMCYFALCYGIVQQIAFFRMYVMAGFWILLFTYLNLRAFALKMFDFKYYSSLLGVCIGGALTHYYVIVFIVFQSIIMVIALLFENRKRECFLFVLTTFISGIHALLLFPYMIYHVFTGGYRGEESLANLTADNAQRIFDFYKLIDEELFGNYGGYLILLFIIVCGIGYINRRLKDSVLINRQDVWLWTIFAIPSIVYFLIISKTAVFFSDRYVYPIYGIIVILVLSALWWTLGNFINGKNRYIIITLCSIFMLAAGYYKGEWEYLYNDEKSISALENSEIYSDYQAIFIYDRMYECQCSLMEALNYESVVFWHSDNIEKIQTVNEPTVIYIPDGKEELLEILMETNTAFKGYEKISDFSDYEKGYLFY